MSGGEEEEGGFLDLGALFAQVGAAQERLESAAAEASGAVLEGSAASGRVTVQITGDLEAVSVHIDPELVDPGDVSLLEDLLLAALRDVLAQAVSLQADVANNMSPLGIDLSAVTGLLSGLGGSTGATDVLGRISEAFGGLGASPLGSEHEQEEHQQEEHEQEAHEQEEEPGD